MTAQGRRGGSAASRALRTATIVFATGGLFGSAPEAFADADDGSSGIVIVRQCSGCESGSCSGGLCPDGTLCLPYLCEDGSDCGDGGFGKCDDGSGRGFGTCGGSRGATLFRLPTGVEVLHLSDYRKERYSFGCYYVCGGSVALDDGWNDFVVTTWDRAGKLGSTRVSVNYQETCS